MIRTLSIISLISTLVFCMVATPMVLPVQGQTIPVTIGSGDPLSGITDPLDIPTFTFNIINCLFLLPFKPTVIPGDMIKVSMSGDPNPDASILYKYFKINYKAFSPKGNLVSSITHTATLSAGRISPFNMSNFFIEFPAVLPGNYRVTSDVTYMLYTSDAEETKPLGTQIIPCGVDGTAIDPDTTVGGTVGVTSFPGGNTDEIQIALATKENAPFIEEDVPYTFVASFLPPSAITTETTPPALPVPPPGPFNPFYDKLDPQIIRDIIVNRFFPINDPTKMLDSIVPNLADQIIGQGGIIPGTLATRWEMKDPENKDLPGYSTDSVLSDTIQELPYIFKDPTEPSKVSIILHGSFETIYYHMTWIGKGVKINAAKDALKKFMDDFKDGINAANLDKVLPAFQAKYPAMDFKTPETFDLAWLSFVNKEHIKILEKNWDGAGNLTMTAKPEIVIDVRIKLPGSSEVSLKRIFPDDFIKGNPPLFDLGRLMEVRQSHTNVKAIMKFPVYDTTAPKIEFVQGDGISSIGDYKVTTGDLKLVRIIVTDNNRFSRIRTPYLFYEVEPSGSGSDKWAGTPLRMQTVDGDTPPPYSANSFRWQTFVPVPNNSIGERCVKWYVDAYDGSSHPRFKSDEFATGVKKPGNHNRGKMKYEVKEGEWEVIADDFGTFSLFDNDRPNIIVRIYEVVNEQIRFLTQYDASEDYNIPDFYDTVAAGSAFKGIIPPDADLYSKSVLPTMQSGIYQMYMDQNADMKNAIIQHEPFNMEDAARLKFNYTTPTSGDKVIFEDRKYLFLINVRDNVEYIASADSITKVDQMSQIKKLEYKMYDPGNPGSTEDFVEIKFDQTGKGTKGWYLGPLDPSLQAIDSAQEAPIFEYSFHTPKTEVSVSRPPYLSLRVMDERDHVRYFHLNFNVIDVKTEFRSYDGQNSVNRSTRSTTE